MKKFISALLIIAVVCTTVAFPVVTATEADAADLPKSEAVTVLTDLGIIDKYVPDAYVSKADVTRMLDVVFGKDGHTQYFKEPDTNLPVTYGQLLMILVDITGYTSLMESYNLDKNDEKSYYQMAVKAHIPVNGNVDKKANVKMSDYAELIWGTLTEVDLVERLYTSDGGQYYIEKDSRLINSIMGLSEISGIVTATPTTSLYENVTTGKGKLAVDNNWYNVNEEWDADRYIGMYVRMLVDEDDPLGKKIYSIYVDEKDNRIITVEADEIIKNSIKLTGISYYENDSKRKNVVFDQPYFVYNNRVYADFNAIRDLQIDDCTYSFIDNDDDGKTEVILAEKYEVFEVSTVLAEDCTIIDTKSNVYDLKDYIEEGGKIYNSDRKVVNIEDISDKNIISYQLAKDTDEAEYTGFRVSSKKVNGILNNQRENYKYITVDGVKYQTLASYHNNMAEYEIVNIGDEVEIFLDFNDRVVDIKRVSGNLKAGYVLYIKNEGGFSGVKVKILTESGGLEVLTIRDDVVVNGSAVKAASLVEENGIFINNKGEMKQQLILYKQKKNGEITYIDSADDSKEGIGSHSNEGFTLDYDYTKRKKPQQHNNTTAADGRLRTYTLNAKVVIGSKYMADDRTKVFGINEKRDLYYFQRGNSITTNSDIQVKLYNVDENYWPEYVVIDSGLDSSTWVTYPKTTYIADSVTTILDPETEELKYRLNYYDGQGSYYNAVIYDNERVNTQTSNPLMYKSKTIDRYVSALANGTSKDTIVQNALNLKGNTLADIQKGTVFVMDNGSLGITGYCLQFVPGDPDAVQFEAVNTISSYDSGDNEFILNGASVMSYGRVKKRINGGIVVNNQQLTDEQIAAGVNVDAWDRLVPLSAGSMVWFYEKGARNQLRLGTASEIIEGDMIFMHRKWTTMDLIMVCRD